MGNLWTRNRQRDPNNSDKQTNESESTAALIVEKLISAVENEDEYSVKYLLSEIFNASHIFVKSWSSDSVPEKQKNKFEIWRDALYIAIEKDTKHSEEIIKLLLDCDIIWCLETKADDLLHHCLIRYEKIDEDKKLRLIEMLLKFGKFNMNAIDEDGRPGLHWAQDEKLISLLIHYGADVNKKDNNGKTPLMHMWGKSVSVLQTILKDARSLVDVDAIDCNGRTALMVAASDARPDVVELLLNAGASVNLTDHLGFAALHHALYTRFDHYDHFPRNSEELKKRKEIFTILFNAKDVEVNHKRWHWYKKNTKWNAERIKMERFEWYREFKKGKEQRFKIVEMLLRRPDIDVNVLSFEKFSPLDIAEAVIPQTPSSTKDALKEKGAVLSIFRQTETQSSGDFHLDVRCRLALQRILLNIYVKDEELLPVDLFQKILLTLIDRFQDPIVSGKDQQGRTALHLVAIYFSMMLAVSCGRRCDDYEIDLAYKILIELISLGCNVNEPDIYGRTPLHYADLIVTQFLICYGADASIKDKDGNSAIYEIPQESSTKSSDIVKAVIDRNDETYFLRLTNNKQMEIGFRCIDSQIRAYDDREFWLKTVPRLLWEEGEYAFRHPLVKQITKEVTDLMDTIAKEIETLDPRFEIRPEFVGSSNEETRLAEPDEFDFCFVLTKISELCEVSLSPELPSGFVRLKRKPTKGGEESDFKSLFGKDGILNTEKLNWQFTTILLNALVNIESKQILDYNLTLPIRRIFDSIKKASKIVMMKSLSFTSAYYISIDIVPCIHVDGWSPDEAICNMSDAIKKIGCNFVFDRPQKLHPWVPYSESCARISFTKAESDLIKHSCCNAREAYMIGKTIIKESSWNCGYILKNCLLYCIEALTPTSEKASQLGVSLEELESKFHQIDRYMWLKCLMKCHLEFVSQDFCPCYFLPNFNTPIGENHLKEYSLNWMTRDSHPFPKLCSEAHAFYRCTSDASSESCCQLPAPDPLWERFDRNQLIASLCEIAYNYFETAITCD